MEQNQTQDLPFPQKKKQTKKPRQHRTPHHHVLVTDSHVAIGVDAAVFLNILHLCWVNMLNLLNRLGLAK